LREEAGREQQESARARLRNRRENRHA
jgi:hypothetical protein